MSTYGIFNWGEVSDALFAHNGSDDCANPWCDRKVGNSHAFCSYCEQRRIHDLRSLVDSFLGGRRGRKFGMPASAKMFFAKILRVAVGRGFVSSDYANKARGYDVVDDNLSARLGLLWFNMQLHREAGERAQIQACVADAVASAQKIIAQAEETAVVSATMSNISARHPECLLPEDPIVADMPAEPEPAKLPVFVAEAPKFNSNGWPAGWIDAVAVVTARCSCGHEYKVAGSKAISLRGRRVPAICGRCQFPAHVRPDVPKNSMQIERSHHCQWPDEDGCGKTGKLYLFDTKGAKGDVERLNGLEICFYHRGGWRLPKHPVCASCNEKRMLVAQGVVEEAIGGLERREVALAPTTALQPVPSAVPAFAFTATLVKA
jgi:hypothetical protein